MSTSVALPRTRGAQHSSALLDPRRLLRSVYLGRLAIAGAIFLAAVFVWREADRSATLVASLLVTGAMVFTGTSAIFSESRRVPLTRTFLETQALFDLVIVTTIVHITGGDVSQFAALYILLIAFYALLLSAAGGLLVSAAACVLYFGDVILGHEAALNLALWLQLGLFATVAITSGYIAARLREARDVREELTAELEKVRLQATDILRNIRSGIITVDSGGALVYANPAAIALLGISLQDRVGSHVLSTLANVSPTLAGALERAATEGVRTIRAEGTVSSGGRRFPIGLNTTFTSHGESRETPATATAIFQDISDQKRLDTLHMRAERLEAVAELSASLAHEIKNPLASIRSAVEQLGRSPRATPDEQTLAGLIVRESDRLSRLLSEFLDFSRVRVAKITALDIRQVTQGAARLVESHPDRPDGVAVVCVAPADRVMIEGDEDLLHRAIFNLALNAVQASPVGGRVCLEVARIGVEETPAGVTMDPGGASIRVSDQGAGIPPEIRNRLFDPFFTTKPGGTGLGLSVVHRAIEAHRGFVFVDSDEHGTRVNVLLPPRQSDSGEAP